MAITAEGQRRHRPPDLSGLSLSAGALPKYVDALPVPTAARPWRKGHYRMTMREFQSKIHRDLPPTTFWGYDGMSPGPTFQRPLRPIDRRRVGQ